MHSANTPRIKRIEKLFAEKVEVAEKTEKAEVAEKAEEAEKAERIFLMLLIHH